MRMNVLLQGFTQQIFSSFILFHGSYISKSKCKLLKTVLSFSRAFT